jgi:Ca2+-transporting ATPase
MTELNNHMQGLTSSEAKILQEKYGKNEISSGKKESILNKALHVVSEPMFMLLLAAAVIYFLLGEARDGAVMLVFVVGIISIDFFQEWKTDRTLQALKDLSAPQITVIRDGRETRIASRDLVPGDLMLICEGVKIPADGVILRCRDLCIDESSLSGESMGVWKTVSESSGQAADIWRRDFCYAGTLVIQGTATVHVEKTGAFTEYGKIGENVAAAPEEKTPLQKQTAGLVKTFALIAAVLLVVVGLVTFFNIPDHTLKDRIIESILSGITLSMAMIPEEFPVILIVFLSMGAWRLAKKNSLVRRLPSVETLGSVSVLCVDKTGTITANRMAVTDTWAPDGGEAELCEIMGLACESDTYDPMEKAMISHCEGLGIPSGHLFGGELVTEYAFTDEMKMMGHVWNHDGSLIVAAKGSPERILGLCSLTGPDRSAAEEKTAEMSSKGLRVIAVGMMELEARDQIPDSLTSCRLKFCGLICLSDPPRENVGRDIAVCEKAGIRVVMITGDNGITASAIAKKIGMCDSDTYLTGEMLAAMSDEELREKVKTVGIFSRVVPEHKMRIVKALKSNGEIVAMTGDGVNDAPALKNADVGIAMGKRGSEVSREAADLILMDDNFSTIVDTVRDGRRIYDNIRKAVGYVLIIHIPIALAALIAPMLGISPGDLFLLPIHIVLLELIIDPTCSVVLERQPAERDIMRRPPRDPGEKLLKADMIIKSFFQGVILFADSFGTYFYMLTSGANALLARSMGLAVIMLANLFLVQVSSSDRDPAFLSVGRLLKDKVMWGANLGTLAMLAVILYTPLSGFLKLAPLPLTDLLAAVAIAAASVLWYDIVKLIKYSKSRSRGAAEENSLK